MKTFKAMLVLAAILLVTSASNDAFARGRSSGGSGHHSAHSGRSSSSGHPGRSAHFSQRARIGVFLGAPLFAPFYYPPSGYYYDPSLPTGPTVYIEQEPAAAEPAPEPSYWYYCLDSKTYYPYVQECPTGWQQVVPQAAPPS